MAAPRTRAAAGAAGGRGERRFGRAVAASALSPIATKSARTLNAVQGQKETCPHLQVKELMQSGSGAV